MGLRVCELFGWTLEYFDSLNEAQQKNLITYTWIREGEVLEKEIGMNPWLKT